MPGASALVTLLVGVFALCGAARWGASRMATSGDPGTFRRSDNPAARVGAAAVVGIALFVLAPLTSLPVYVITAAAAAISTAAAIGIGREIGAVFAAPAYTVPSLRPHPAATPGGISAGAAAAAAAGAALTVAFAYGVRLLGPSDGGLVFLAAMVGALFERWLEGAWRPRGPARLLPATIAAIVGASCAAAWVILLP